MLLVLKIPVVYLACVVWWAIRAEPAPQDGLGGEGTIVPLTPCGWDEWKRGRRFARRGLRPLLPSGRPSPVAVRGMREVRS